MTTEEWLEKVRADRPPLTAAQLALLRPILAPVIPHVTSNAAPTVEAGAAPAEPEPQILMEGPQ